MSAGLATTKLAFFRGTTTNDLGDEVDNNSTPVVGLEARAATVIDTSKRVQDPASGLWRTVRYKRARMTNPNLDVHEGDRVIDLTTDALLTVDDITRTPRTLAGGATLTLDLTDRMG